MSNKRSFLNRSTKLVLPCLGVAVFFFVACSDGSATSTELNPEVQNSFATFDELPNCSANREGETATVESEKAIYQCVGGRWQFLENKLDTAATAEELPNCSDKYEGISMFVAQDWSINTCLSGRWEVTSRPMAEYQTVDDLPNCSSTREGDSAKVISDSSIHMCINGAWEMIFGPMGSVATADDLPNCTENLFGDSLFVVADSAINVCANAMWISLGKSLATEDDLQNCTESREGNVVYIENMGASLICRDGRWNEYSPFPTIVTTDYLNQKMLADGAYGEFLDERDNQIYKTIKIGDITWIAQNMNYNTNTAENTTSYCYDDDPENCEKYGRLYTWSAVKNVCPTGWRQPTPTELYDMVANSESGVDYRSSNWSNGMDETGFSAVPAGRRDDSGEYLMAGSGNWVWSGLEYTLTSSYLLYISAKEILLIDGSIQSAFSVRCMKK